MDGGGIGQQGKNKAWMRVVAAWLGAWLSTRGKKVCCCDGLQDEQARGRLYWKGLWCCGLEIVDDSHGGRWCGVCRTPDFGVCGRLPPSARKTGDRGVAKGIMVLALGGDHGCTQRIREEREWMRCEGVLCCGLR